MAEDKKLQWMYDGPKSLVNREDYLLGKKIDKNFELYSDVTVKDREEREDIFTKKKPPVPMSTGEGIPMVVARQEDPLAAIRLREAKRRQEILNNPILKLKAEKMLRKEFEKARRKAEKKEAKKRRKHERKKRQNNSSRSSSSEDERPEKRERTESDASRRRNRSPRSPERKISSPRRHGDARSSSRPSKSPHRRRSRSTEHERRRSPHRRRSHSRDDKRTDSRHRDRNEENRPSSSRKSEDMARRLKEMQDNAKWKEQVRQDNVRFAQRELENDANTEEVNKKNAAFIKAFKQRTESSSVADKIQQNRHRLKIDRSGE